jgi:hypothetical protein
VSTTRPGALGACACWRTRTAGRPVSSSAGAAPWRAVSAARGSSHTREDDTELGRALAQFRQSFVSVPAATPPAGLEVAAEVAKGLVYGRAQRRARRPRSGAVSLGRRGEEDTARQTTGGVTPRGEPP